MKIVFDFELTETPIADTPKVRLLITELRAFIYQRLKVLEREMTLYNGAVAINVLGTMEGYPLGWAVAGFPENLKMKIMESLTEQDFEYVINKILTVLDDLK